MSVLYQPAILEATPVIYVGEQLRAAKRLLVAMVVVLLGAALLCAAILRFASLVQAASITPVTPPVVNQKLKTPKPTPKLPTVVPAAALAAPCVPYGAVPTPTALPMTVPGLQQLIDTPDTYSITGTNHTAIGQQLHNCAPHSSDGTYSGVTSYWIGAHYNYTLTAEGDCKLSDITVAVHISQVLPTWNGSADADIAAQWEAYEHNLVAHENGHAVIDISQAQLLLHELTALPAQPCDMIAAMANNVTAARLAALDAANADYDTATNHGATQGASW